MLGTDRVSLMKELRGGDDESSVGDESEGYIEDGDAFRDVLIFEA
jgi:hypothetical protein